MRSEILTDDKTIFCYLFSPLPALTGETMSWLRDKRHCLKLPPYFTSCAEDIEFDLLHQEIARVFNEIFCILFGPLLQFKRFWNIHAPFNGGSVSHNP